MKHMLKQPTEDLRDLRDGCERDLDCFADDGDPGLRIYVTETRIVLAEFNAEIARRIEQP